MFNLAHKPQKVCARLNSILNCTGYGVGVYASQINGFAAAKFDGDLIIHASTPTQGSGIAPSARNLYVTGRGVFNGCTQTGGADLAEFIRVSEKLEPGDVVEIDPNNAGHLRRCTTHGSLAVAGVISTTRGQPGGDQSGSGRKHRSTTGLSRAYSSQGY